MMLKTLICFFIIVLHVKADTPSLALSLEEIHYLQKKETYKLCVDPQSSPFEEITPEGIYRGITADLVEKVARRIGIVLEIQHVFTWDDSLKLAKSGQCDILTFMAPSEETHKWLLFSEPLFIEPNVLITREEHPYIEDISKLSGKSIAIPIVFDLFSRFSKEFENMIVIPVATKEEALHMVSTQKADMTIRSMIAAAYSIKKEGLFNLKISGEPVGYEHIIRLSVMHDELMLLTLLNKAIATLSQEEKELSVNKHITIKIEKGMDKDSVKYLSFGLIFLALIFTAVVLWNALLREKVALEVAKNNAIQKKLFQASKEAEIGRIIANISHQWRGTLAKIGALNLLTLVQLKNNQPLDKSFMMSQSEEIGKLLDFMSNTMQDFLEFYKPSKHIEEFELKQTVEHAKSILETKITKSHLTIEINGNLEKKLIGIKNQWVHIWLNFIDNTINAALKKHIVAPYFHIVFEENRIVICDNAGGMETDIHNENEMGLGIYMCVELVKKHGGDITYQNVDDGLKVIITFST
ncbi:MAG: transporter substrate-binding domain-containing protein [Sulfurospirillum sp.]|nr:transporter substrate-binding domain-containing protein [Sulfurospirillum sp.]